MATQISTTLYYLIKFKDGEEMGVTTSQYGEVSGNFLELLPKGECSQLFIKLDDVKCYKIDFQS